MVHDLREGVLGHHERDEAHHHRAHERACDGPDVAAPSTLVVGGLVALSFGGGARVGGGPPAFLVARWHVFLEPSREGKR